MFKFLKKLIHRNDNIITHVRKQPYQPLYSGYQPRQRVDANGNPIPITIPTRFPGFTFTEAANGIVRNAPAKTDQSGDK